VSSSRLKDIVYGSAESTFFSQNSGHIPYRNSKLTHLLENALGGNANIAVICTLSAETHHSSETLESLKFASRCAQVETQATQGIVSGVIS
jgi:centromeric protein E